MSGRRGQYVRAAGATVFAMAALLQAASARTFEPYPQAATSGHTKYIAVGEPALPPIGWVKFCNNYKPECDTTPSTSRDVVFTPAVWTEMATVNNWANDNIEPMTSMEH